MLEFTVRGIPGPQGSKSFKGMIKSKKTGRSIPRLVESSAKVKPWREAVKHAALAVMGRDSHTVPAIPGAVIAEMTFTMERPKSAKRGSVPCKRYDLDKLIRSTNDALTQAGAWEDDSRIVSIRAAKRYPNEGPDALDTPGAVIRIRSQYEAVSA